MAVSQKIPARIEPHNGGTAAEARQGETAEVRHERWAHCYVNWTAVWVGALASISMVILFGLVGTALGAHLLGPEHRVVEMKSLGLWTLIFSVCGAFFSSVVGGWVAAKIAGILHSEPAIIHGAIVWLVTVPLLVAGAAVGASSLFGGWYAGLGPNLVTSANPPFFHPDPLTANATAEDIAGFKTQQAEYNRNVKQWHDETPQAVRNSALGATVALLLGLLGCVIGAWMASGEPMNFTHYRTRKPLYHTS
jgi:hypothetical protein